MSIDIPSTHIDGTFMYRLYLPNNLRDEMVQHARHFLTSNNALFNKKRNCVCDV